MIQTFAQPYRLIWSHRTLLLQVVRTTIRQRFAGAVIGSGWMLLAPLVIVVTYAVMFVVVLRVQPPHMTSAEYVVHMTCGLVLFLTVSQALMGATSSLSQDPSLLFNQVFPSELFPIREVLAVSPLLVLTIVGAPLAGLFMGTLGWAWLLVPPLIFALMMTLAGCGWILSLANLIIRDTAQILAYALTVLMLTSPIAYDASVMPRGLGFLVTLNPFAYFMSALQGIVVHGKAPAWPVLAAILAIALIAFHSGFSLFRRGKSVIAESL
jgi:lipopolysaccharide transport system permease protein